MRWSSCSARTKLGGSLGRPSVARTTTAFWPCATSFAADGAIWRATCCTASVSGVVPVGDVAITALSCALVVGAPAEGTHEQPSSATVKNWPRWQRLSRWKCVVEPIDAHTSAISSTTSPSSAHRVAAIVLYAPPGALTCSTHDAVV